MSIQLSLKKAILYAVDAVVSNPWYFVKLTLMWLVSSVAPFFAGVLALLVLLITKSVLATAIIFIISLLGCIFAWFLPQKLLLGFIDKENMSLSLQYLSTRFSIALLLKLIISCLLCFFAFSLGLMLLVVPGIYLMVKFMFVPLILMDTNCGIFEAFSKSFSLTSGNFWRLLGLSIITYLLMSIIITFSVAMLMTIHAYRQLNPMH